MKVAFCLYGIHYIYSPPRCITDYSKTINNYKKMIINELKNIGHDVDIFIASYKSEKEEALQKDFQPVSMNLIDFSWYIPGIPQVRHLLYLYTLITEYEKNNNILYDFLIFTRFDLIFFKKFTEMNIDLSKINISFQHNGESKNCEDNFFILPRYYLDIFISAAYNVKIILHEINHNIPSEIINYMYKVEIGEDSDKTDWKYYCLAREVRGEPPPFLEFMIALNKKYSTNLTLEYLCADKFMV